MARASDEVRIRLENDIQNGVLGPGDTIDERTLSARFDVSRTPAREAILQLAASGLVEIRPRRGAIVMGVDVKDAFAMTEALVALESEAAGLAARRMTTRAVTELADFHAECGAAAETGDSSVYIEANARFHRAIHEGGRNEYLAELISSTRRRMAFYHKSCLTQRARIGRSFEEHAQVLGAISEGDPERAASAMRRHILSGGQVYADIVAALPRKKEATAIKAAS